MEIGIVLQQYKYRQAEITPRCTCLATSGLSLSGFPISHHKVEAKAHEGHFKSVHYKRWLQRGIEPYVHIRHRLLPTFSRLAFATMLVLELVTRSSNKA
jgi:hypothetical protein